MVLNEEQVAFSDWINQNLKTDQDVQHHLPLNVINYLKINHPFYILCHRIVEVICMRRWMMVFFFVK